MSRDILERLATPEVVALRCRGGTWPRSMFSQPPIPDKWMGLLVRPDGQRKFVPAGEDPNPQREDTLILVRNQPITVPLELSDAPTTGEHTVSCTVELLTRWLQRDDDLAALFRTLLTENELSLNRLANAVRDNGGEQALRAFVRGRSVEDLVHGDPDEELLAYLRAELKRFAFAAGFELERLGRVDFASETLSQAEALKRETARQVQAIEARGVVERAASAATHRRLDDLGSILVKLKSATETDENLQWRELLPALTPGERGRLLENLWRLTPDRETAQAIIVAAGRECVWLPPTAPERIDRRVALPEELGGLRSVSFDPRTEELLVGAACGVWRLRAADGEIVGRYMVPLEEQPRTGFNAATTLGGRLFATHSQLGAWSWDLENPDDGLAILEPVDGVPRTIRAVVTVDDNRVLIAADERVHAFKPDGEELWQSGPADGRIHCLAALEDGLYAGTSSGTLMRCDLQRPAEWLVVHRGLGAIESIDARRWDDLIELVIPAGRQGVHGVYGSEGIVARLLHSTTSIRRAWASDDAIVALTEHRDRLVVLHGEVSERQGVDVPVARMLGHSIQDVCLVSERGEATA
jgi:hypothetical protein